MLDRLPACGALLSLVVVLFLPTFWGLSEAEAGGYPATSVSLRAGAACPPSLTCGSRVPAVLGNATTSACCGLEFKPRSPQCFGQAVPGCLAERICAASDGRLGGPRAQRASTTDSRRLFERRERSERSELRRGASKPASRGLPEAQRRAKQLERQPGTRARLGPRHPQQAQPNKPNRTSPTEQGQRRPLQQKTKGSNAPRTDDSPKSGARKLKGTSTAAAADPVPSPKRRRR